MTDYSTAASKAADAIDSAAEGLIEGYDIGTNHRSVKRGKVTEQVDATAKLEGLAARRAGKNIFSLAKPKSPR